MRALRLTPALALLAGCGLVIDVAPPDRQVGLDAASRDASTRDAGEHERDAGMADGGIDGGVVTGCESAGPGARCGEDGGELRVCNAEGRCAPSRCGDAIVDARLDEECDDGNEAFGDGCDACVFSCHGDGECGLLGDVCASATCSAGACVVSALPEGATCTTPVGNAGTCVGGTCRSRTCGDAVLSTGEECDDGNTIPNDGCEPDCTITCTRDDQCSDGVACNGEERCVLIPMSTLRRCERGPSPTTPACFVCSLRTGAFELIDADGDGFAPGDCGPEGGDCNDADAAVHPGAADLPNGADDDCDGRIDEDAVAACLRDADGDGFGSTMAVSPTGGVCPPGTVPASADPSTRRFDCNDANASVFPGQTMFSSTSLCPGPSTPPPCFDYDCNGADEPRFGLLSCRSFDGTCEGAGFAGTVPPCGSGGTFGTCSVSSGSCVAVSSGVVAQQCR